MMLAVLVQSCLLWFLTWADEEVLSDCEVSRELAWAGGCTAVLAPGTVANGRREHRFPNGNPAAESKRQQVDFQASR